MVSPVTHVIAEISSDADDAKIIDVPLASGASRNLPSPGRILLLAVVLPALVATSNQVLIWTVPYDILRWCLFPSMAISTAVLSWCMGRHLNSEWLSWLVFGWSLALLNLLTIAVCLNGPIERHFAYLLVTAQLCLVTLWAILGGSSWQWRLPAVLVAVPIIVLFASASSGAAYNIHSDHWAMLMVLMSAIMALLCASLRIAGFTVQPLMKATNESKADSPNQVFQFGLRHLLIWSAALVPLLLVGRGIDFFIFRDLNTTGIYPWILLAAGLAVIDLMAIWAILGSGRPALRVAALIFPPLLVAVAMYRVTLYVASIRGANWWNSMDYVLEEIRDTLFSWMYLNAFLLAALLLFLRAKGYRLVRNASKFIPPLAA